ncbi:hypothetical protein [Nitrosomonas sp. sh817]|uniref:hypothetical protein n=1 Tax=Nitrosomonas sp. sh817 TaxID=3070658 RepID=UPI0027DD622E|nr:hypothetical protein [Nitrosomonas sp. sh817]WMJ09485.1 hypothetical protein RBH92_04640 [Nitrosomonas sp. sh817]
MRYRRADVKGGTYFFTVNLAQRHLRLLLDHVEILREAVKTVKPGRMRRLQGGASIRKTVRCAAVIAPYSLAATGALTSFPVALARIDFR